MNHINYDKFPNQSPMMIDALKRYFEEGLLPGHFLQAVLTNDLTGAVSRADDTNRELLIPILIWFYNEVPSSSWGTTEKMYDWANTLKLAECEQ